MRNRNQQLLGSTEDGLCSLTSTPQFHPSPVWQTELQLISRVGSTAAAVEAGGEDRGHMLSQECGKLISSNAYKFGQV